MRGGQSYRVLASAERDLRLHKLAKPADDFDDADAYGILAREIDTPENRKEANRQWAAIPSNATELREWMRGDPINGGDA